MLITTLRILVLILLPALALGQSISVSASSNTANNNTSTFMLADGEVTIGTSEIQFDQSGTVVNGYEDLAIAPDLTVVGVLQRGPEGGKVSLFNSAGVNLNSHGVASLSANDPSLAVYALNNGEAFTQSNINRFTFYNTFGEISTSISSSSQSKEGEAISEVAISENGATIVIYNPKIKRSGNLGSKAQIKLPGGAFENIFFSQDRFIKNIKVSKDGSILGIITSNQGQGDELIIMDKLGNEINRIKAQEPLKGFTFSENARNVTIYSQGRVMVYPTTGGSRLGSTSLRNQVFLAQYFPEDNLILILTGRFSESSEVLRDVEIRGIDLKQRKIASETYSEALGLHNALTPSFEQVSDRQYQLKGASRLLMISTDF